MGCYQRRQLGKQHGVQIMPSPNLSKDLELSNIHICFHRPLNNAYLYKSLAIIKMHGDTKRLYQNILYLDKQYFTESVFFVQQEFDILITVSKTFDNSLISYTISISGFIRRFKNDEMHGNFFKLLGSDETSILVGARNVVYNITLPSLKENINQVILDLTIILQCSNF